jgi:hypothetical protein
MDILRIFLALMATEDLECNHFNIKNMFTKSTLKERIFLLKPKGVPVRDGYVLRVLRSLLEISFKQSLADPCLFTIPGIKIIILIYVDDILFAAPLAKEVTWFD